MTTGIAHRRRSARRAAPVLVLAILGGAGAAATEPAPPPPPAAAFGTLPVESNAVISPDGRYLAWLERKDLGPKVLIFDLEGRKTQRTLTVPEGTKLQSLAWNDSETLLITVSRAREPLHGAKGGVEEFATIAEDVGGGLGRPLPRAANFPHAGTARAWLVSAHTAKPKMVLMLTDSNCGPSMVRCMIEVDTRTGIGTVVAGGTTMTTGWVVDRDGHAVAREDWDYRHNAFSVAALVTDRSSLEIFRKNDKDRPLLAGLVPDGDAVVILDATSRGNQAAWAVPLDGSPKRILIEDSTDDITGVYRDPYTGGIVGAYLGGAYLGGGYFAGRYLGGGPFKVLWTEPAAQQRFDKLQRSFPGRHVEVQGWSQDGSKTLARVESPSAVPVYYLVDFTARRADIAAEEFPQLASARLGTLKELTYSARDGTSIVAYLTLPPDRSDRPVPLIVLPHDGPQHRDYPLFSWFVQFLATHGYAVLQPQFRGSTGFGLPFREAGYRQWGRLMQDDLTDAVHAMVEQGIADPHRVCIVGNAYGGYAALAGVAFTPELYRCAVSINGISDVSAMVRDITFLGRSQSTAVVDIETRVGPYNSELLTTVSPINAVKAVTAPVLLIYGTGVGAGNPDQSENMAKALKAAGKDVTVVQLPGADHWLSTTELRVRVLNELEAFLKAHL